MSEKKLGNHCGQDAKSFAIGAILQHIVVKRGNDDLCYGIMTCEFLGKYQNSFSAVQSEKTEINILQKEWGEKLFFFLR